MKIAFTTKGTSWDSKIDPRFGRTEYLLVFDEENNETKTVDNREVSQEAHGVGPKTAKLIFDLGVDTLITGNGPGGNAATVLEKSGTKIFIGAGDNTVKEAYDAFKKGTLKEFI